MKKITSITVVNEPSATCFEEVLIKEVRELQEDAQEVTIINPHMVESEGMFNYIAVIESRKEQ